MRSLCDAFMEVVDALHLQKMHAVPPLPPGMTRERARTLACVAAYETLPRPSYVRDTPMTEFEPHDWVVQAILKGAREVRG